MKKEKILTKRDVEASVHLVFSNWFGGFMLVLAVCAILALIACAGYDLGHSAGWMSGFKDR